jgi:hypothetical protein
VLYRLQDAYLQLQRVRIIEERMGGQHSRKYPVCAEYMDNIVERYYLIFSLRKTARSVPMLPAKLDFAHFNSHFFYCFSVSSNKDTDFSDVMG